MPGQLAKAHILCSHYFAAQDGDIYAHAVEFCQRHKFRIAAVRSHAKILLIETGNHRIVICSSANLRACHSVEQACIFNDPELFAFHRAWIDEFLTKGAAL